MLPVVKPFSTKTVYDPSPVDAKPTHPWTSNLYLGFVWPIPTITPEPNSAIPIVPPAEARSNGVPDLSFTDQIVPDDKL